MTFSSYWRAVPIGVLACIACVQDLELGRLASSVDAARDGSVGDCEPVRCTGQPRDCADCVDNDGDGLADHEDPDCWGPCDESEETFGGADRVCSNNACYFQRDCGTGNDALCLRLVPNGCDCRGCCVVAESSEPIFLGSLGPDGESSCNSSTLDDPMACQPCELDETCFNPCEQCELCFGSSGLDPGCSGDAGCGTPQCDDGIQPCGACAGDCESGMVCITGCCVEAP